jgi:CheY-like chemotaxis protein
MTSKFYFMSGDISSYKEQELLAMGADAVLSKPVKYKTLVTMLSK